MTEAEHKRFLKIISQREAATREMHAAYDKYLLALRRWRDLVFKENLLYRPDDMPEFGWPESGYSVPRQYTAWIRKRRKAK